MVKKKTKKKAAKKKPAAEKLPEVTPYPAAGPKVTAFEQKLDEGLGVGDKPKRGRPPKQPEPEPAQVPTEIIRQAVQVPFDLWAISQNLKELKLDDKEAAMLAEPVKTLLDYYAPQMPVIVIAWASLTISTYAVMKPRLETIAKIKKASSPSEPADRDIKEGSGQGGPIPPVLPADKFPTQHKTQKL